MPEISYGINKNLMLRAASFLSNRSNKLYLEGGSLFVKYRFFSSDDLHSHFRLAAYGRVSKNSADIHQEQIETMGHNSGVELGLIATKLVHKTAISSSISLEKATNNDPDYIFPEKNNEAEKSKITKSSKADVKDEVENTINEHFTTILLNLYKQS
jgi:hypothetical protein